MGMNLLIKASGKESRGAIMESGIRQPPIRGFMDDQTITTPSHVQARWILKALDMDSYPYHQWSKSLRWHSAKLWWCTETPAMKRSEMQTSPQDQDASGQLTSVAQAESMLKLKDIIGNPCMGRQGLGKNHFQHCEKADPRQRRDMIQKKAKVKGRGTWITRSLD